MKRAILALVCLAFPCTSLANVASDYFYVFPAVAKVMGAAGTDWRTELCVTNLAAMPLDITVAIASSQADTWFANITVSSDNTQCFEDVIDNLFHLNSFNGWMTVAAFPDDNGGVETQYLTVSVKIYNATSQGTYGQDIPAVNPSNGLYGLDTFIGAATGIQNYGAAGQSGFRTNIGLMSIETTDSQNVMVRAVNSSGTEYWTRYLTLGPMAYSQFPIPEDVTVVDGLVLILSGGAFSGWASVVDNRTGDGLCRMPIQIDVSDLKSAGPGITNLVPPSDDASIFDTQTRMDSLLNALRQAE